MTNLKIKGSKMKFNLSLILIVLMFLFYSRTLTQNPKVILTESEIKQKYPKAKIEEAKRIGQEKLERWKQERIKLEEFARQHNIKIREEFKDGKVIELQGFENGHPVYYGTYNYNAAKTISTDILWDAPYLLSGNFITAAIWDGGKVLNTHQELVNRVTQRDTASEPNDHATHVSGTMIATGIQYNAKGMASNLYLDAYDWNGDVAEMYLAPSWIQVSNHSYGLYCGWEYYQPWAAWRWYGDSNISQTEDYRFGFYNSISESFDELIFSYRPYHLPVVAAGNDRNDIGPGPNGGHYVQVGQNNWVWSTTTRDPDGGTDHYECIPGGLATAKNVLTVGAVEDIPGHYSNPNDVVMTDFSSWGPTDDGRIKPDVVANGYWLYSSIASSNNSYGELQGTSQAAPNVSGSVALILEAYENNYPGRAPLASTLKGLIIHTADEAGAFLGPDYRFGWGLMNTKKAVDVINLDFQDGEAKHIVEYTYVGSQIDIPIEYLGTADLIVTLCWSDPPGEPPNPSLNPTTKMLVNDLDLQLIDPLQTITRPYVLNPNNPSNPATTGDNDVDNVEKVFIPVGPAGQYIARVTHEGASFSQDFSLIVTGGKLGTPIIPEPPPGYYRVIVDQKLSDDITSVGRVTTWNASTPMWNPQRYVPTYYEISTQSTYKLITPKASKYVHYDEKFNRWQDNSPYLWKRFNVNGNITLTAKLKQLANATLDMYCTSANSPISDNLWFKDPWFIDYDNPAYYYVDQGSIPDNYKAKDYRNLGTNAIFEEYETPFDLTISDPERKGVILNQNETFNPNVPIYYVRAQQQLPLPFKGQNIQWYFSNWNGTDVLFQYPNQIETAVVFRQDNAVARADYKGHLVSNSTNSTLYNGQRKIVFYGGIYHLVYEDNGNIYYTNSSDDGQVWTDELRISDDLGPNRTPCIAVGPDGMLCVVWQFQQYIKLRVRTYSGTWQTIQNIEGSMAEFHEFTPVIDYKPNHFYIVWRNLSNPITMEYDLRIISYNPFTYQFGPYCLITGTNSQSKYPSLVGDSYNLHLVWEESGHIYYSKIGSDGQTFQFSPSKECVSAKIAYSNHKNPCITLTYGRLPNVIWQAYGGVAIETEIVIHRRRTWSYPGGWGSSTVFIGNEYYYKPSITGFPEIPGNYELRAAWTRGDNLIWNAIFNGSSWIEQYYPLIYGLQPNLSHNMTAQKASKMVFRDNSLPYFITTTSQRLDPLDPELEKITDSLSITHHRRGVVTLGESEIAFQLGDLAIDDKPIDWVDYPDTVVVGNNSKWAEIFCTKPFIVSNQSRLSFFNNFEILNRSNLSQQLSKGVKIEFKLEAVETNSGNVLTALHGKLINKTIPNDTSGYHNITLKTAGTRNVFLRVNLEATKNITLQRTFVECLVEKQGGNFLRSGHEFIELTDNFPKTFSLMQNYPNPFNPTTTISFDLPEAVDVRVDIFDVTGRQICTLVNEPKEAGTHQVIWNGQDDQSNSVASGLYVYRIQAGAFVQSKKLLFMK